MKMKKPGIFWQDWQILAEGQLELGLKDFIRVLEKEREILESALLFVIDDMNSAFYDDSVMHRRCTNRLNSFGVDRIVQLREFLEDPFPSAFTVDLDEAERRFYEKAVIASELFRN